MTPNTSTFCFKELTFPAEPTPNRSGGKLVKVGYGPTHRVVECQLGASVREALHVPFEIEQAGQKEDPSRQHEYVFKVDVPEGSPARRFLDALKDATLAAAEEHSVAWFKKKLTPAQLADRYKSNVKLSESPEWPDRAVLKVFATGEHAAKVWVATLVDGKMTKPVAGTYKDIRAHAMVLPKIKVKGGVYFLNGSSNFGTSLVVTEVLVLNEQPSTSFGIDVGDVDIPFSAN